MLVPHKLRANEGFSISIENSGGTLVFLSASRAFIPARAQGERRLFCHRSS